MPRKKQKPEIAEHVPEIADEYEPALFPGLAAPGETRSETNNGTDNKKGKEYSALTTKLAEQRLIRLKHQNSKLKIELRKLRGQVVPLEQLKREVLAANQVVKNQLLALPDRLAMPLIHLTDPRDIRRVLRDGIADALNDLAYETETQQ
jgi:hypothetical protein